MSSNDITPQDHAHVSSPPPQFSQLGLRCAYMRGSTIMFEPASCFECTLPSNSGRLTIGFIEGVCSLLMIAAAATGDSKLAAAVGVGANPGAAAVTCTGSVATAADDAAGDNSTSAAAAAVESS